MFGFHNGIVSEFWVSDNLRTVQDAKNGYVGGKYTDFLNPTTYDWDAKVEHNIGNSALTQFTSWTANWKVAKHFATREGFKKSHGIVVKADIMAFRIFKSPNLKKVAIDGLAISEGEYLVVGPVQGIPIPVK